MAQTFLQPKFVGTTNKLLQFDNAGVLQAVDVTISGILPQIVVMTETGSQVTCNKDGVTLTATEQSGKWVFNVPTKGSWTCSVLTPGGEAASDIVNVLETKQYKINIEITPTSTIDPVLDNNDWTTIQAVAQASEGSTYWSIGDTKSITFLDNIVTAWGYSSISQFNLVNQLISAIIIGFDHNSALEGTGITFQLGRISSQDVCIYNGHEQDVSAVYMGFSRGIIANRSIGGENCWENSSLRNALGQDLSSSSQKLLGSIPAEIRLVIKPVIKYSDNGLTSGSGSQSDITSTIDVLFIPSVYEVTGSLSGISCNPYESSYQEQYEYFFQGGPKRKYGFYTTVDSVDSAGNVFCWWTRSKNRSQSYQWYAINTAAVSKGCSTNHAVAPCFVVG